MKETELLRIQNKHYISEKEKILQQMRELTEAYVEKESTQKELQEAKMNSLELKIMSLEMSWNKDSTAISELRQQNEELIEAKSKLETEIRSYKVKAEYIA